MDFQQGIFLEHIRFKRTNMHFIYNIKENIWFLISWQNRKLFPLVDSLI